MGRFGLQQAAGPYPAGDGRWRSSLERTGFFDRLGEAAAEHRLRLQPPDFIRQVRSWSWIANLPVAVREGLVNDIDALVHGEHEIDVPYRTDVYWTRRR